METNRIEQLLNKFYDGLTTDLEEKELKSFFQGDNVPDALQAEKDLFMQLTAQGDIPVPDGLDERLSRQIDDWARPRTFRLRWIGSIAASIAIVLSIGWYANQHTVPKDTFTNVEDAYIEAQRALVMFSNAINKGMDELAQAKEKTSDVMEEADKSFRELDKQLQRINNENNE